MADSPNTPSLPKTHPQRFFDDAGLLKKAKWDEVDVPGVTDQSAYALEITGDSMLPVYREGDIIIVSPNTSLRKSDRVVVKTTDGAVRARVLRSQSPDRVELGLFDPAKPVETLCMDDIDWIARIIWATQ